jgi:hypothetical protein
MPINAPAVGYVAVGGLILYSGIKGASLSDTAKAVLSGNLTLSNSEPIGTAPSSPAATPAAGDTGAANGTAAENQTLAKSIATQMGYSSWTTGQTWSDWVSLWNQESGWSGTAQNPTSTAYGIAQFLDTTWEPYGPKTSDVSLQIKYGIEYIADRYGSPVMAWAHEESNNWY